MAKILPNSLNLDGVSFPVGILARDLHFPEGPAFDLYGNLWFVELHGGNLCCLGKQVSRISANGNPNGLTIDYLCRLWICDAGTNSIRIFNQVTRDWQTVIHRINGEPLAKPNDLAFDNRGNLIFTCPGDSRQEPTGYVGCLLADGSVKKIAEELYFPNGLIFVNGGKELIVAETYRHRLLRGKWDSTNAKWIDTKPFIVVCDPVGPGPDGMALGGDGLIYVAVFATGEIKVIDLEGRIHHTYSLPNTNPTNVAFDPSQKLGLVVTEAKNGLLLNLPKIKQGAILYDGRDTIKP